MTQRARAARSIQVAALGAGIALAALGWTPRASADEVQRCIEASERGQVTRRKHQLLASRDAFVECAAATCPRMVRSVCAEWLNEVEPLIPSLVISLRDEAGGDIPNAQLEIDGHVESEGVSVAVDPGPHTVRARAEGYHERSMAVVAREGERNRAVEIRVRRGGAAVAAARQSAPDRSTETASPLQRVPAITWLAGGATLAALGSFAFFGLTGRSDAADLRATCAPSCAEAARDDVRTRYIIADLSLVVGVLLGGITAITFVEAKPFR